MVLTLDFVRDVANFFSRLSLGTRTQLRKKSVKGFDLCMSVAHTVLDDKVCANIDLSSEFDGDVSGCINLDMGAKADNSVGIKSQLDNDYTTTHERRYPGIWRGVGLTGGRMGHGILCWA